MRKIYTLLSALVCLASYNATAQINYSFSTATGTYTPLSGGTVPTLVSAGITGASAFDEGYVNNVPIGFTLNYNGTNYSTMHINTNGFIALGDPFVDPPANGYYTNNLTSGPTGPTATPAARPIIAPLWDDLDIVAGSNLSYALAGTAPNRVLTVQFSNVLWSYQATAPTISFQIKLYETSNVIEFIYRQEAGAVAAGSASIGITASGTGANNFMSVQNTTASATASKASEVANINTKPATGQIFRFTPSAPITNDVSVNKVYALGKVGRGVGTLVSAVISNLGTNSLTNVNVTLTVSGANTYTNTITVASLPASSTRTVQFPLYNNANVGANTLTVSVPADQDASNNSSSATQDVTVSQMLYGTGSTPTAGVNAGNGNTIVAKFAVPYGNAISSLNIFFTQANNTYEAVIYDNVNGVPGTALWTSSPLTTTVGENIISVSPVQPISDSFYVGVRQTGTALGLGYQTETPLRTGTFYLKSGTNPWFDLSGNPSNIFLTMIGLTTNAPLPVLISQLSGEKLQQFNKLSWTTFTEQNNYGFEVERSADGRSFSSIGFIKSNAANGNSAATLNYTFPDSKPFSGNNYYRLKQIDIDGKTSFSNVVLLKGEKVTALSFSSVYPNPAKDKLSIIASAPSADRINLVVTDLAGKVVKQQAINVVAGDNNLSLEVTSLPSGSYILKAVCATGCETAITKFVKQ
ncbi:T9SS type A sorting domain-containing protein [Aridibaculum aurantiacum]|uniref:T9SS type A sorting domain-containing protein n=1 Tax=Aridibaculum aurantiacum TaxID=2810307 RepID=UPI001A967689|nr:T9SS type A sorting domain-containing protein [Aridibaculum aurantiacum]